MQIIRFVSNSQDILAEIFKRCSSTATFELRMRRCSIFEVREKIQITFSYCKLHLITYFIISTLLVHYMYVLYRTVLLNDFVCIAKNILKI